MYICVQVHTHLCMGLIDLVVCVQYIQCVLYNAYVCVCVRLCVRCPSGPYQTRACCTTGSGWSWLRMV